MTRPKKKTVPVPVDQSIETRRERIYRDGSCPVHGVPMGQVDGWYYDDEWGKYTIVGCSKYGCGVAAKAFSISGPWQLLEEHCHLLDS